MQQSLRTNLKEALGSGKEAEKIVQQVRRSLDVISQLDPNVGKVVRECYGRATRDGFALVIGITFFAVVASFFVKEKRLSR